MAELLLHHREEVRALSRAVFGQEHRLALIVTIARRPATFTLGELAESIGVPSTSSLQRPLRDLLDCGFIERQPTLSGERSRPYLARPSVIWQFGEELLASLDGQAQLPLDL